MSVWKMTTSTPGSASLADMASLMAYMQHTDEQYSLLQRFLSRLPTHWRKATRRTGRPSEGRSSRPSVGPPGER